MSSSSSSKKSYKPIFDAAVKKYRSERYEEALPLLVEVSDACHLSLPPLISLHQALSLNPHLAIYDTKCAALLKLNRNKEALAVARQMIAADERSIKVYQGYRRCITILMLSKHNKQALAMANLAVNKCKSVQGKDVTLLEEVLSLREELRAIELSRLSSYRDPMTVLPVEMILDIVELATESSEDYGMAARLSHVSRLWRQRVLDMPQLWRRCRVTFDGSGTAFQKLDAYYNRANQTPLRHLRAVLDGTKEYWRFFKRPLPYIDVNAERPLSTLDIVSTKDDELDTFDLYQTVSESLAKKVDTVKYAHSHSNAQIPRDVRPLRCMFLVNNVVKEVNLDSVYLMYERFLSQDSAEKWDREETKNDTLRHFKISRSYAPSFKAIALTFPSLKSLEWDMCTKRGPLMDRPVTEGVKVWHNDLQTLIVKMLPTYKESGGPPTDYALPALRYCELVNVSLRTLECVQKSPKLAHLSVHGTLDYRLPTDHPDARGMAYYMDRFVGVFEKLPELEVLDVTAMELGVRALRVIVEKRLCPRLKYINVSRHSGAFGRLLIDLVKQRNGGGDSAFTPIDTLVVNYCQELEHEAVTWVRKHVQTVQCVYTTKEELKAMPRQRYRYERV
ncbi:hypothetical protein E3P99_03394 [Wallemia hederae]|uniref:Uncharacterized protein n=1 Tax=Wallemia hederae TaxID=1540922 RepID=A0A4T0FHX6_9BASI|nr:hypothetical protein E3P99_03394 [Wallemia hederae]